jgi:hypothetical protein
VPGRTSFEPYVAEPAEPTPTARGERLRPLAVVLILIVLASGAAWLVIAAAAAQDPALEVPPPTPPTPEFPGLREDS